MNLKLNVKKEGLALSPNEVVNNEEFQLNFGHIFRGPKGDSGEKGEKGETGAKGDNGKSPKISDNGTWLVYSDELKTFVDTGIKASGSDNNYTDADKALVQTIPNKVDYDTFNASKESLEGGIESLGEYLSEVGDYLVETKADKEGYYPAMSVGMADNLVGRGDVQDAHINFRPSAGVDNITDGAARIERIKGNSVVWNQLITNSRFETKTNYNVTGGATLDIDSGIATITLGASNYSGVTNVELNSKLLVGHKYLFVTEAKADAEMQNVLIPYALSASVSPKNIVSTEWRSYSFIKEAASATMSYGVARAGTYGTDFQGGEKIYAKSFRVIDLTKEFGAGNEPTTVEEYLLRKPINIEDEYAYNEGELIDMKVDELVSVGDNAFNPNTKMAIVIGGQKYHITDSANTSTLEVSFWAKNEDDNLERVIEPIEENGQKHYIFPANGYCRVNNNVGDICVCLKHSYEKPIKPYQQDMKDLSFIGEAFPEGMRSAGSAFDEIRFNPTKKVWEKVTRIGVVDLGSLDWGYIQSYNGFFASLPLTPEKSFDGVCSKYSYMGKIYDRPDIDKACGYIYNVHIFVRDSSYVDAASFKQAMQEQGVKLYYELAEPIVVELDYPTAETNMDYLVWDFGTEEAIASYGDDDQPITTAPFRADINYEPNAVDDLRWAVSEIRKLKAHIAQMQTSVTNLIE